MTAINLTAISTPLCGALIEDLSVLLQNLCCGQIGNLIYGIPQQFAQHFKIIFTQTRPTPIEYCWGT